MTYYQDLTDCWDYFGKKSGLTRPLIAVGWLDSSHPYATGAVSTEFTAKLQQLLEGTWEPVGFAGGHDCPFCAARGKRFHARTNLHLPAPEGFYVAPRMILHYMTAHNYAPPLAFQKAVLACPEMFSNEFFDDVAKLGFQVPHEEREMWRMVAREGQARKRHPRLCPSCNKELFICGNRDTFCCTKCSLFWRISESGELMPTSLGGHPA